jgi:pilus assembly protein FimV
VLKTDKKTRLLKKTVLAAAMLAAPLWSHAAGLGKISVFSSLGQPLKAEIEITATPDELPSIKTKLAPVDAFRQADVEYNPLLAGVRFSPNVITRNGRRFVQVMTDEPVNEPFLNMIVELSWSAGQLVREYTFLLDPPETASTNAVALPAQTGAEGAVQKAPAASDGERGSGKASAQPAHPSAQSGGRAARVSPEAGTDKEKIQDKRHKVQAGETLGQIALQVRPEGVSLEQMLVALLRRNEDAFAGGNMNRLKVGKILQIPDAELVNQVPVSEARKEVVAQAADFNAYRNKLASSVASRAPSGEDEAQLASGKITPKVEDKAPASASKDKLEVSRTESGKGGVKDQTSRVASQEADVLARDKALKEAQSRATELETNLGKLKRLAEMEGKSAAGQPAQENKQAARPAEPVSAGVSDNAAEKATPAADGIKPAAPLAAMPPPKPHVKKIVPVAEPEPEPGFVEENPVIVLGGGGVLALLLGWFGLSAWRKKRQEKVLNDVGRASDFSSLSGTSAMGDSQAAHSVSGLSASQFSVASPAASEHLGDVIAQAETFLAFGRTAQAEEVLTAALATEPQRHAVYLKLLDIYAAQSKTADFAKVAKQLHEICSGEGHAWETARTLGLGIDPTNPLYQPSSAGDRSAGGAGTVGEKTEPAAEMQGIHGIDTENLDFDLDFDLDEAAPQAAPQPVEAKAEVDVPSAGGEASALTELQQAPKLPEVGVAETPVATSEMPALDFDFDLNLPEASPEPQLADKLATASGAAVAEEEHAVLDESLPLPKLDVDFDVPSVDRVANEAPKLDLVEPKKVEDAGNSIDFDFDLPLASPAAAAEQPAKSASAEPENALDFDFEVDLPASATATPASAAEVAGPVETVKPGEPVALEVDNPEVATKLELAAAYEEMGDNAGAIELYQEALGEGSQAQKDFAKAKLANLG